MYNPIHDSTHYDTLHAHPHPPPHTHRSLIHPIQSPHDSTHTTHTTHTLLTHYTHTTHTLLTLYSHTTLTLITHTHVKIDWTCVRDIYRQRGYGKSMLQAVLATDIPGFLGEMAEKGEVRCILNSSIMCSFCFLVGCTEMLIC